MSFSSFSSSFYSLSSSVTLFLPFPSSYSSPSTPFSSSNHFLPLPLHLITQTRYLKTHDIFFAEYGCLYDSCALQAHVTIYCGTNRVKLDYFLPSICPKGKSSSSASSFVTPKVDALLRQDPNCPVITFVDHDHVDDEDDRAQEKVGSNFERTWNCKGSESGHEFYLAWS